MEEKVIIKSQKDSISKLLLFIEICWTIIGLAFCIWGSTAYVFTGYGSVRYKSGITQRIKYDETFFMKIDGPLCILIIAFIVVIAILLLIVNLAINKSEIVVTEDRVYGKAVFGRRVDLPMDSISAIGTTILKGISVSTSSGIIRFVAIKNVEQIRVAIIKLLNDRQDIKKNSNFIHQTIHSNADELKKYKELFDDGIISQEEFEVKKKQLLNL